jgi:hypothetical protein
MAETCTCTRVWDEKRQGWRELTDPECPVHGDSA